MRLMAVLVACAVGLAAGSAVAQTVVEVSGEVSCAECRITMDTVLTLGGLDGPGSHLLEGPVPLAAGEGPGEYALITHLNVGPEFIHVFDGLRGRTVLDADHGFVRADRFRAKFNWAAVTESETVIFAGDVPSSESVGHRLHILSANGDIRSYGGDGSVYRGPSDREFAVAANDSLAWIVDGASGRVEEWALLPEPKLSRILNRSVEEFDRENKGPLVWPTVANVAARLTDHGLWILWWGIDPGWTKRTSDPKVANEWGREAPWHTIFDGVLDLIDPGTGRTLARYRSDVSLPGFVYGSDMVMAYEETQEGVPRLHLLRPTVHGIASRTR